MITTSDEFLTKANGSVRPLDWACNISFTKERNEDVNWFVLDASTLNGQDLLSMADDQPIQQWDYYAYEDYKDKLMSMSVSRSVKFPYNVQSAIADFSLDNHEGLFTIDGKKESYQVSSIYGNTTQEANPTPTSPKPIKTITGTLWVEANGKDYPLTLTEELCKLGNYQDKIYKSNGKWCIEKNVGKINAGDVTWTNYNNTVQYYAEPASGGLGIANLGNPTLTVASTHFRASNDRVEGTFFYNGSNRHLNIYPVGETKQMTGSQFKSWLTENNVIIYYALATPRTTEITNQTTISQLEKIDKELTKLSTTKALNIKVTADGIEAVVDTIKLETPTPLADYILPARPVRLYLGFKGVENVPKFVGLTEAIPQYSGLNNTRADFTAMDFLSSIGEKTLNASVMLKDARTDEAIAVILEQFGIDSSMYQLDEGSNVIPFLVFNKGKNAGNALRELVLAENGKLWLSETGIIRFSPRVSDLGREPVALFDESNIIEYVPSRTDGIYNRVRIKSDVREVQDFQPIFSIDNERGYDSDSDNYRVRSYGNLDVWLDLEDPAWTANVAPILNGENTTSNFTAVDLSGSTVNSGVVATGELFADSIKLHFENQNAYPVSISFLQIWGEPAKVVNTIDYDAYDQESVEKYGENSLEITDNNFFGSYANVDSFATSVLTQRASYSPTCDITVKGNPALQLDDIVVLNYNGENTYKIVSMVEKITQKGYQTTLTLERFDVVLPFVLDNSILNGEDRLG